MKKAILKNVLTGECVKVHASTEHSASSYGRPVWVDVYDFAYCEVDSPSPFYEVIKECDE